MRVLSICWSVYCAAMNYFTDLCLAHVNLHEIEMENYATFSTVRFVSTAWTNLYISLQT